jgi:hypothetical protein
LTKRNTLGIIRKIFSASSDGAAIAPIGVGDRYMRLDTNPKVWVVKRMAQVGEGFHPHVCISREDRPELEKTISLSTLTDKSEYQPSAA